MKPLDHILTCTHTPPTCRRLASHAVQHISTGTWHGTCLQHRDEVIEEAACGQVTNQVTTIAVNNHLPANRALAALTAWVLAAPTGTEHTWITARKLLIDLGLPCSHKAAEDRLFRLQEQGLLTRIPALRYRAGNRRRPITWKATHDPTTPPEHPR
jgi:hypothetical protein